MQQEKSIKKNFMFNTLLTVTTTIIPLITFPYLSRTLLVESNGKVDFATSVINYFIMFASLGIPTYGIRACAKVRDNKEKLSKTVHELLVINIFMTCITYAVFLICLLCIPRFEQEIQLMLITSINLLLNCIGMNWLYSALEEYKYITIRSLLFKLVSVICIFLFIHNPNDYKIYAVILVFSTSGSNILNFVHSRKFVKYGYAGPYNISQHFKPILTFFATTAAISIYSNLDIVMVGFISGDAEVGYYTAALKIRTALATLAVSLGTVLLPRLSYLAQNDNLNLFKNILKKSFQFMFLMAVPIVIYFMFFAQPIIRLIAGSAYLNAVPPLRYLLLTVFFAGLSNVTGTQTMVPLGMETKQLISIIAGAVVDLLLNTIFIPQYGSTGAACATAITEVVVLFIQCIYIRKILLEIKVTKYIVKPLISAIISIILTVGIFYNLSISLWLEIFISGAFFCLIYGVVLLLTKEEFTIGVLRNLKFVKEKKNEG